MSADGGSVDLRQDPARLRAAATVLRRALHPSRGQFLNGEVITADVVSSLADWLEGEASMSESLEPVTELFAVALEQASGGTVTLGLVATEDGGVSMRAMTTDLALRLADRVLAAQPA